MKLIIDIPQNEIESLCKKIMQWRELSPFPLTNLEALQTVEKEISAQLTHIILSGDALNNVLINI